MDYQIQNPILPGFYPDPSIVRVEDDFYMITSSFSYYPGVPIFHSRDLVHWEQIGHVLDRPSQLPLDANHMSAGIYAPTLRYHEGTFYMVTTNVDHGGNFIVTAENPAGPWSDPHWITEAPGIDPSLFWDDDGKAYFIGICNGIDMRHTKIWISEIDLETFRLAGEKNNVWGGAMIDTWCAEAPHVYKKDGYYYLMIAEGGTEFYHSVTISRSRHIMGPYENYDGNPILTHRHLSMYHPIISVGHGDLVELKDGSWYMVMLGSRPYGGHHKNMGRETFLAPVIWENDWPVVSPETGKVEFTYPAPPLEEVLMPQIPATDDFDGTKLGYQWIILGTPSDDLWKLENSRLKIRTVAKGMESASLDALKEPRDEKSKVNCAGFVGRRQQHMNYRVSTTLYFTPEGKETAGLILLQNDYQSLRAEMALEHGERILRVWKGYRSLKSSLTYTTQAPPYQKELCGQMAWKNDMVTFELQAKGQKNSFYAIAEDGTKYALAENLDGGFLGSETAGGFIGACIGMFASGNGVDSGHYAAFDQFTYLTEK